MKKLMSFIITGVILLSFIPGVSMAHGYHGGHYRHGYSGHYYNHYRHDNFGRDLGIALGLTGIAIAIDNANRYRAYPPPVVYSNEYPRYGYDGATEAVPVFCVDRWGNSYVCAYRYIIVNP